MRIKNRNLFRITRFILLKLPGLLKFIAGKRKPQKRLLIIKTDAIGDYVLFRNFIEIVKNSDTFKDCEIHLLGNELWREIAVKYDGPYISEFIFINPDTFYDRPLETLKSGWRLFKNNYRAVLQPAYSRTFITDGLAAFSAAAQIAGFEGDVERINIKYKVKTDKFYTQLLPLPKNINFEFGRTRFFFETVLQQAIGIHAPFMPIAGRAGDGIVIFPGAGILKRSWEAGKFLSLIKLIRLHTSQPVYLAGSPAEAKIGDYLTENLPAGSVNNLMGKTSLLQMIELVANAGLVIANETSAIHIAAATNTKAVCILGGGHFGRFAPYPETIESGPVCIYKKMDCYNCNWNCIFQTNENERYPCVCNVGLEQVWNAVNESIRFY
jgi:ADP-heptose:LPS heptosyltransferase